MAELTGTAAEPKQSVPGTGRDARAQVAMLFIDQTIISIASPTIQQELGLSRRRCAVGGQRLPVGTVGLLRARGRLSDILGHKRMVLIGVTVFAVSSALCGLTPANSMAEAWIIVFPRGARSRWCAALPAAIALIVDVFPVSEQGRRWRCSSASPAHSRPSARSPAATSPNGPGARSSANIPVALLAIVLTLMIKAGPASAESIDWRGAALVASGMALAVLDSSSPATGVGRAPTWGCITAGVVLLVIFVLVELDRRPTDQGADILGRAFAVDNLSLFFVSAASSPSSSSSVCTRRSPSGTTRANPGCSSCGSSWGSSSPPRSAAASRHPRVKITLIVGCAVAAVGFVLWARATPKLDAARSPRTSSRPAQASG